MSLSLTLQPNLFQLFQPIGGVGASELEAWEKADGANQGAAMTRRITAKRVTGQRRVIGEILA
jgi:hypothetical protein